MAWIDRSVLEAVSWRLASELLRRHPDTTRLVHSYPCDGQYDVLWIVSAAGSKGDVRLNRAGTIQVHGRFDGRTVDGWAPTEWDEYLRADPREFVTRLEIAAGLPAPYQVPAATPATVIYRVLAAIAATAVKSVHPIEIQLGFIDAYLSGPNEALDSFPAIPIELRLPLPGDLNDQPGYRFWIVVRDDVPILAFEHQVGFAWTRHHTESFSIMALYDESRRDVLVTALKLLRLVDQV